VVITRHISAEDFESSVSSCCIQRRYFGASIYAKTVVTYCLSLSLSLSLSAPLYHIHRGICLGESEEIARITQHSIA